MTPNAPEHRHRRPGSRPRAAEVRLWIASACLAATLSGCAALEYYWQGVSGQFDIVARAHPISDVIASTPDPALRERLEGVQRIRAFASRELALPDNGSYTRYADLGRAYVVWNVFAAPEFALTARQWCFPVAGCVAYRGYFAEADARAEATRLASEGFDVHVSGVPAYSTLGYFDDPVLSTFVRYREVELARLVFHELAHQVVYVRDDTSFNESFATAVEEEGLSRWLKANEGRPDARELAADAARSRQWRAEFRSLVAATRERVEAVYASAIPDADKRTMKAEAFGAMRERYERLKGQWNGAPLFDRWFAGGANNAGLVAAGLYADRVPQFAALLAEEGGDLRRFYRRVESLAALPKGEREVALREGAAAGTSAGRDTPPAPAAPAS